MKIRIKKDTADPRGSREKELKKGLELVVDKCPMWDDFIKSKKAELVKPDFSTITLNSVEAAEEFELDKED